VRACAVSVRVSFADGRDWHTHRNSLRTSCRS
jgi:hypothetical protein